MASLGFDNNIPNHVASSINRWCECAFITSLSSFGMCRKREMQNFQQATVITRAQVEVSPPNYTLNHPGCGVSHSLLKMSPCLLPQCQCCFFFFLPVAIGGILDDLYLITLMTQSSHSSLDYLMFEDQGDKKRKTFS